MREDVLAGKESEGIGDSLGLPPLGETEGNCRNTYCLRGERLGGAKEGVPNARLCSFLLFSPGLSTHECLL